MSGYLTSEQVEWLLRPINPARVGKDGKGFSHVEAYEIRAHLNRTFGFARWSADVLAMELLFETEASGKWSVAYSARLRLTVAAPDGTDLATYSEYAVGDAKNQPSRADAHDLAIKTAESQALKRAAANLGDGCGLSLYRKGSLAPLVVKTLVPGEGKRPIGVSPQRTEGEASAAGSLDAHITETPPENEPPAERPPVASTPPPPTVPVEGSATDVEKYRTQITDLAPDLTGRPALTALMRIQSAAIKAGCEKQLVSNLVGERVTLAAFIESEIKRRQRAA